MRWLYAASLFLSFGLAFGDENHSGTSDESVNAATERQVLGLAANASAQASVAAVGGEAEDANEAFEVAGTDWGELSGYIAIEERHFFYAPLFPGQRAGENLSAVIEPLYHLEWDAGRQDFAFRPFFQFDNLDPNRTHWDIRDLEWIIARTDWEIRLGIRTVFWGVAESQNLVDIINQTDLVANIDGEDKLGQPMANLALIRDWGTLDFFFMPYFRERTFPARAGRLRFGIPINEDRVEFVRGGGRRTLDWALRYSHYIGNLDFGLSYFHGTGRDPIFRPDMGGYGGPELIPVYFQIDQIGLDAQMITGDTLWKLEVIQRSGFGESFVGGTGGFEHTFYGVWGTPADVGLIAEYLYNDKNDAQILAFENDLFLGIRIGVNDASSTEVLFGAIQDIDDSGTFYNLEASRRIGQDWKLSLEGRFFVNLPPNHPQYSIREDDYLALNLAWYF